MTCDVLTKATFLHRPSEKSSFVDSKADQNDDRDTLDFEFESDKVTMSSLPGNTAVANIGVGINGKLLKSIIEKRQGCVRYYLKCGANPNVTTSDKRSALHLAVLSGHVKIIQRLLDAGAYASPLDELRNSPLHVACRPPQVDVIKMLLQRGADPNAASQPQSVLHCAIRSGSVSAVQSLVDAGADLNVIGLHGRETSPLSPLGVAFMQEDWRSLVPILLRKGARIDRFMGNCLTATAFEAILYTSRDTEILKYLIQNGCFPYRKHLKRKPFISINCRTFRRSLVALLLRLVQDGTHDLGTVKSLLAMLEASGYILKKDPFCEHLKDTVRRMSSCLICKRPLESESCGEAVRLTETQVDTLLRPFHWSQVEKMPNNDMLDYISELAEKISGPKEVPSLMSMCRLRVRKRLYKTHKVHELQNSVDQLPLPGCVKRYLMIEDVL